MKTISYNSDNNLKNLLNYLGLILIFCTTLNNVYPVDISLDGKWKFTVDSTRSFNIDNVKQNADWTDAVVSLSWQAQFENLRNYQGTAWYLKTINIPAIPGDETAIIKFEAVDYLAEIYINNKFAGKHEGGYTPFEFEIRKYIHPGENEIIVKVTDPVQGKVYTNGINYAEIPHGKQSWYIQNSGIWQSAFIQLRPKNYIKYVHLLPSMDGNINFNISVNDLIKRNYNLKISISDNNNKEIRNEVIKGSTRNNLISCNIKLKTFQSWSPDSPVLYKAKVVLNDKDTITEQFGFRTFEAKNKKFYLNGKPIYLIGALDQDFYPETIYTPPSEEYIRDEMVKAKKLGLNMLRCHIKVPDRRYLKAADEVGLLIWYEVPNRDTFTVAGAERSSKILDGMIERDWNHPSIVILSLINESWGIDLQNKEQRDWLKKEYHRAKKLAKGRLIVDNSACYGNFHIATDINDYHTYWSIPDWHSKFNETIKNVNDRPKWLFSNFGDSEETGEEPLLISEFGNWGLPKLPVKLPWWFDRGLGDNEITIPTGAKERFDKYKYNELFRDLNELCEYSQQSQFNSLKYEIEQLRLSPGIQGYIITEFTDLNWECNGLLDMWRNYKIYSDDLSNIQQQDIIIPGSAKFSYAEGDSVLVNLSISHYSDKDLNDMTLFWDAENYGSGSIKLNNISNAGVTQLKPVVFHLENVKQAGSLKVKLTLQASDGNPISKNFIEFFILPKVQDNSNNVYIYNLDKSLYKKLTGKSIKEFASGETISKQNKVIITNTLDDEIVSLLKKGVNVLLFADSTTKVPKNFPYKLISRNEGWYDGNWVSNMNWVKTSNPFFSKMKMNKIMGFESSGILPGYVLTGIKPEEFSDVLTGMFTGWLHLNSGYIVQMKAGKGNLLICTLQIPKVLKSDAFANYMYNNLINYAESGDFNPKINWQLNNN